MRLQCSGGHMSKSLQGLCVIGGLFLVYVSYLIYAGVKDDPVPAPQYNSLIIGALILAALVLTMWGMAEWVRGDLHARLDRIERLLEEAHRAAPIDPSVVEIGQRISRRLADND